MFTKALITARDLLVSEGDRFSLEVEVERRVLPFVDPAIAGALVEIEGEGRARTDAAGRAFFPLGPLAAGVRRYRARLPEGPWRAAGSEALVKAIPAGTPVFVADIDGTIADVTSLGFALRAASRVRPLEGARAALEEIARRAAVVYLTARDHVFASKTREWLRLNSFPEGPVLLRRVRLWSASPRRHKEECLKALRAAHPGLRWGIGDLRGDAEAYAAAGLVPILIGPSPLRGLPAGSLQVTRWAEVPPLIS